MRTAALLALALGLTAPASAATPTPATPTPGTPTAPGDPTAAPSPPPVGETPPLAPRFPEPGEAIFTELFIDPAGSGERLEFIEIKNVSAAGLTLEGCYIIEGSEGISATCAPLGGITGNCDDLQGADGPIVLAPGGFVVVGQTGDLASQCGVAVAQDYSNSVSMANTKAETLHLYCPDSGGTQVEITSITYDWKALGGTPGSTWQLDPALEATAPTDPASWCEAPRDDTLNFCTTNDGAAFGSPGADGVACPEIQPDTPTPEGTPPPPTPGAARWPVEGEVIFTELFIDPPGTGDRLEFVELRSDAEETVSLEGCYLIEGSAGTVTTCPALGGELGNCDDIKGESGPLHLDPGAYTVLAQTGDLADSCGVSVAMDYSNSVSMANTIEETMRLRCPAEGGGFLTVASITYDWAHSGGTSGHSWMLDPEKESAPGDPASWCPTEEIEDNRLCDTADGASWASPGLPNPACGEGGPVEPGDDPGVLPQKGDVIMTELFIDPAGSEDRLEFVELKNLTDTPLTLEGCVLLTASEGTTQTCATLGDMAGICSTVPGGDDPAGLSPRGYVVLAQTADLATECGVEVAWDYPNALSMVNTKAMAMSLYCPDVESGEEDTFTEIFSIGFNWKDLSIDSGRSWMLDPLQESEAEDAASWCGTEAIEGNLLCVTDDGDNWGSPGGANPPCPTDNPPPLSDIRFPSPGEVIFTELYIDPAGDDNLEFVELKNLAGDKIRLEGCVLIEGSEATTAECGELDGMLGNCDEIEGLTGPLTLDSGAYALLAQSAEKLGSERCAVQADADYVGAISLANTVAETIRLYCPGEADVPQLIASLNYDWDEIGGEAGETWSLDPDHEDAPGDPYSWCTADAAGAPAFCTEETGDEKPLVSRGTPGAANPSCPSVTPPPPATDPQDIRLVFTEIMVGPVPSTTANDDRIKAHEWFEWVNLGDVDVSLVGCYLEVGSVEGRGTDEGSSRAFHFADDPSLPGVTAGSRQLWARDGCLVSQREDDGSDTCIQRSDLEGPEALAYPSLEFSNSSAQYLALFCAGEGDEQPTLIDEITFDYTALGEPRGRSWQVKPEATSAAGNDDEDNWCLAPIGEGAQLYAPTTQGSNFGTPGHVNSCEIADVPVLDSSCGGCFCRLDTAGATPGSKPSPLWRMLLATLGLGLITRRPR